MTSSGTDLGPLLDLAQAVDEGSIGVDAAKDAAREHGRRGEVTPQQLTGVVQASLNVASEGQWRRALPIAEVAYEAALAAHTAHPEDTVSAEAWLAVGADLLEILHWALLEQGDIRMYLRAKEIAESGTASAEKLRFPRLQGLLALRFGTLVLDAYTTNRTPANYQGQFDAWVARALQGNDPALKRLLSRRVGADGEPADDVQPPAWPSALEGLALAETYLRAALPLVIPERRGRTLKAIVQALEWRTLLGGTADAAELRKVAQQALDELDPGDEQGRLAVLATLTRLGEAPDDALVRRLEHDWAGFLAETEEHAAWDAVGQAAMILQYSDPRRALAVAKRRRELKAVWADETQRARHFELELLLLSRAYGPEGFDPFEGNLEKAAELALAAAGAAVSPEAAREAAAAIIGVMLASPAKDREALGLGLVEPLFALDRTLWDEHEDAVASLMAGLLRGEGVNHMRARDVDTAGRDYRRAVEVYRDIQNRRRRSLRRHRARRAHRLARRRVARNRASRAVIGSTGCPGPRRARAGGKSLVRHLSRGRSSPASGDQGAALRRDACAWYTRLRARRLHQAPTFAGGRCRDGASRGLGRPAAGAVRGRDGRRRLGHGLRRRIRDWALTNGG